MAKRLAPRGRRERKGEREKEKKMERVFIDRIATGREEKVTTRERDGWSEAFLNECRKREKAVD